MAAVFTFPLRRGSGQLGALDLYRDTPGPLSDESMSAAQTLADVAAAYLVNAQARTDRLVAPMLDSSLRDRVTGLPTRPLLMDRLEQACQRGARSGKASAVFFVTLSSFRSITGHPGSTGGRRPAGGRGQATGGNVAAR